VDDGRSDLSVRSGRVSRPKAYYDEYWSEGGFNPDQGLMNSLHRVLERTVRGDEDCIDVGCGRGRGPGAWLAAHTGSYLGVDVSEAAVEAARGLGLNAQVIEDASRLPFPDASFDLAVCLEVLEHLVDPQLAASEMLRILRPGGRVLVTVPNVAYWRRRLDLLVLGRWNPMGDDQSAYRPWRDPHLRFFGQANLARMLFETGFTQVQTGGHGGSWMTDIPGVRRLMRRNQPGPLFKQLVGVSPSLFAHHLHAVGVKPAR
jgi:ubiquinone/menaquinone biosynthesis C-methylase UbiE